MATSYTKETQDTTTYSKESQNSIIVAVGIGTAIIGSNFIVGGGAWGYTKDGQNTTTYTLETQI